MDASRTDAIARIVTHVGIIEQLVRSAGERLLKEAGLTYPEFAMLMHFSHGRPPEKTVTGIAAAMQQNQPAVTKTAQKLLAKGLLKASPSAADGRSKTLTLTAKGRAAHERALALYAPLMLRAFEGWEEGDLGDLARLLDRLKTWLDANR